MNKLDSEIRITNVSHKMKSELKNIARHYGLSMSSFLKPKVRELIDSHPIHIREKED